MSESVNSHDKRPKRSDRTVMQWWVMLLALIVFGIMVARLVRAGLEPTRQLPEAQIDLNLA